MKRVAIILVSLFLLLSLAMTIYIVVAYQNEINGKNKQAMVPSNILPTPLEVPAITSIPTAPTAVPTVVSVSTAVQPNQPPLCTGLSGSPTSGKVPLTVQFIGSGTDLNGTLTKFEFNYGDGRSQTIEKKLGDTANLEISHTYLEAGQYTASLRILDNQNSWSAPTELCRVPIATTGTGGSSKIAGVTTENIGQPNLTPTVTPTPTIRPSGTITPTRTPTPTKTASASATPVTAPDVPVAGSLTPTIVVGLGGLFILALGLLFAL